MRSRGLIGERFALVTTSALLRCKNFSDAKVLVALLSFRNRRTGRCDPSFSAIAAEVKMSASHVAASIARLETAGLLIRAAKRSRNERNSYVFDASIIVARTGQTEPTESSNTPESGSTESGNTEQGTSAITEAGNALFPYPVRPSEQTKEQRTITESASTQQPKALKLVQTDRRTTSEIEADRALQLIRPNVEPHLIGKTWTKWRTENRAAAIDMVKAGMNAESILEAYQSECEQRRSTFIPVLSWVQDGLQRRASAADIGVSIDNSGTDLDRAYRHLRSRRYSLMDWQDEISEADLETFCSGGRPSDEALRNYIRLEPSAVKPPDAARQRRPMSYPDNSR